jgi:hypothetical protein
MRQVVSSRTARRPSCRFCASSRNSRVPSVTTCLLFRRVRGDPMPFAWETVFDIRAEMALAFDTCLRPRWPTPTEVGSRLRLVRECALRQSMSMESNGSMRQEGCG